MTTARLHSEAFDVIPFEDIKGGWKKLGSGSFGNVYKGNYLGIDVAIKEVLPSNDYDVAKYFEREWRLMKEARHPNVVLYLGLSRAPDPDGRIFIISEFIDNGNLRNYIHDKSKPFPWRLRLSFATDIARALAYLHARRCIHRDLKGENLLVTENGRLKITDFGFARIAARNADESRRLTFCGTDSYMSPEILLGEEFDLPTDIYSLGIILCEIAARKLADDNRFKRAAPTFAIDPEEVLGEASPGCPPAFVQLCLDCLKNDPAQRPTTRAILERLRDIEAEVLARPSEADEPHLGSVKFMTGGRRPGAAPRIPSFGMGIGKDIRVPDKSPSSDEDTSDEELMEAVTSLQHVDLGSELTQGTAGHGESQQPLIGTISSLPSEYSTTVVRGQSRTNPSAAPPSLSSILTIRASPNPNSPNPASPNPPSPTLNGIVGTSAFQAPSVSAVGAAPANQLNDAISDTTAAVVEPTPTHAVEPSIATIASIDSFQTAPSSMPSIAGATEGGSTIRVSPSALVHRFTLIKPGAKRSLSGAVPGGGAGAGGSRNTSPQRRPLSLSGGVAGEGWSPFDFFFASGVLAARCDLCTKRIGWKPILQCDDCGLRAHIKCGELAPRDCGLRPPRPKAPPAPAPVPSPKLKDKGKGK